jgi:hypothetical protein
MEVVAQLFDQRQNLKLALHIKGREWLVHQEEPWRSEQCPAERDALLLAARESAGLTLQEMRDAKRLDHRAEGDALIIARGKPSPEPKILSHGEVWEELGVLKHESEVALIWRHENVALGINENRLVQCNAPAIWPNKACDQIDGGRFAGA